MRIYFWNDCCDRHRNGVLTLKRLVDVANVRKLSGSEYAACIIALNNAEESFTDVQPKFCTRRIIRWFRSKF